MYSVRTKAINFCPGAGIYLPGIESVKHITQLAKTVFLFAIRQQASYITRELPIPLSEASAVMEIPSTKFEFYSTIVLSGRHS